jgi:hypothetical protein
MSPYNPFPLLQFVMQSPMAYGPKYVASPAPPWFLLHLWGVILPVNSWCTWDTLNASVYWFCWIDLYVHLYILISSLCQTSFFSIFFGCRCEWWNVWEQDMIGMICRGQRSYIHLCLQSLGTGRVGGLVLSTHAGRTQLQLERERGQMRTICTATDRTVLALYQL